MSQFLSDYDVSFKECLLRLHLFSSYIREAWRLQNQSVTPSSLPEHMHATEHTALKGLDGFAKVESDLGCRDMDQWEFWLQELVAFANAEFGPMADLIAEDVTTSLPLQWERMVEPIEAAIAKARQCIQERSIDPQFDWEPAGRAAGSLAFALGAAHAIKRAQRLYEAPSGLRASKNFDSTKPLLNVRVLDGEGNVIGQADTLETAMEQAKRRILSQREIYELTRDEFVGLCSIIPVHLGRGKTGRAKQGALRMITETADGLSALRKFAAELHDPSKSDLDYDQWIGRTLSSLLSLPEGDEGKWDVRLLRAQGVGYLAFAQSHSITADTLAGLHEVEVEKALADGLEVPQRVMDHYSFDASKSQSQQRMSMCS